MNAIRRLVQVLVLRPIMFLIGVNVVGRENLMVAGPAIIVANHNSHIDTAALLALVPNRMLPRVHPAAAADYFLRHKALAWFSLRLVGIVPVDRTGDAADPLADCSRALGRGDAVILFPEGSRGEPEHARAFRRGVAHLIRANPGVPVVPVLIEGAGRVLPKGSVLPIPLGIDVTVGEPMRLPDALPVAEATSRIEEAVWNLAA